MKCSICQTEMPSYALFCTVCGTPLEAQMKAREAQAAQAASDAQGEAPEGSQAVNLSGHTQGEPPASPAQAKGAAPNVLFV